MAYQSARYARRYLDDVVRVARVEHEQTGGGSAVAAAYATGLHKLMAYKDEYEVARLHLLAAEEARRDAEFGAGAKVQILLQPPLCAPWAWSARSSWADGRSRRWGCSTARAGCAAPPRPLRPRSRAQGRAPP